MRELTIVEVDLELWVALLHAESAHGLYRLHQIDIRKNIQEAFDLWNHDIHRDSRIDIVLNL